jgi:hypothetical protein
LYKIKTNNCMVLFSLQSCSSEMSQIVLYLEMVLAAI